VDLVVGLEHSVAGAGKVALCHRGHLVAKLVGERNEAPRSEHTRCTAKLSDGLFPEIHDVNRHHEVSIANAIDLPEVSGHRSQPSGRARGAVAPAQLTLHRRRRVDGHQVRHGKVDSSACVPTPGPEPTSTISPGSGSTPAVSAATQRLSAALFRAMKRPTTLPKSPAGRPNCCPTIPMFCLNPRPRLPCATRRRASVDGARVARLTPRGRRVVGRWAQSSTRCGRLCSTLGRVGCSQRTLGSGIRVV